MSFKAMAYATKQEITKTSPQSHLLLILASYTNEFNETYPSISTMMEKTRLSEKTVRKSLKDLIEFGLLSDSGDTSKYGTKIYKFNFIECEEATPSKNTTPSKSTTGKNSNTPSKSTANPLVDLPPDTVINPIIKQESHAPAQNSEIDLSLTEKPTAIETFEFLKQSLVFGSEFGVISERQPNLSEINALVTEVDCFWSNKHLTKKQLLGKILSSVGRLSVSDRLGKYTVTQDTATDAPVVENWDSRQGEQISDFVAPLPMKGFVRWKHYTAQT